MDRIFREMNRRLDAGERFALVVIDRSDGSTPRKVGSKMLVASDASIYATVGGGSPEAAAIDAAVEALETGVSRQIGFDLSQSSIEDSAPICGGSGSMLVCVIDQRHAPVFQALRAYDEAGHDAHLIVRLDGQHAVLYACGASDGRIVASATPQGADGAAGITPEVRERIETLCGYRHDFTGTDELGIWYGERVGREGLLYILGGGHVSLATAQVADIAGFSCVVIDDRQQFANPLRFPQAHTVVMPEFAALRTLGITPDDSIVIATRGHSFDRVCLEWALTTSASYIGMIGSARKVAMVFEKLRQQGVPQQAIEAVHAPIGLPIGGNTPGEIAVSIVGQLIEHRVSRYGE